MSYRYDIKPFPTEGKTPHLEWFVVDTCNNYAPVNGPYMSHTDAYRACRRRDK